MKKVTQIILILLSFVNNTFACSCSGREIDLPIAEFGMLSTESEKLKSFDDLIFHGTLIKEQKVELEEIRYHHTKSKTIKTELHFKIVEAYKGNYLNQGDTIIVYTQSSSDACGFYSKLNTNSIIFATSIGLGKYFTYRGDCCKSVSEADDKKRYDEYLRFIESITNKIDGIYNFKQPKTYWKLGGINDVYSEPQLTFQIKNGELHNEWKLTTKSGDIIEIGNYEAGKKIGVWKLVNINTNLYEHTTIIRTSITYKANKPILKLTEEVRRTYNYDSIPKYKDEVVRTERTEIQIIKD